MVGYVSSFPWRVSKVTPANALTSMYRLKELPLESLSLFFWGGHGMGNHGNPTYSTWIF